MVRKFLMSSYNTAHEEKYFGERFQSQPGSYRCMKKIITIWAAALVVLAPLCAKSANDARKQVKAAERTLKKDGFKPYELGAVTTNLEKYFQKGDGIVVSGEMQSNKGRKEETKKITYWTVLVREWDFAEKRGDGKADPNTQAELEDAGVQEDFKQIDEDVPF